MSCQDTSSNLTLHLNQQGRLIDYVLTRMFCEREISKKSQYKKYCCGKTLDEITRLNFHKVIQDLGIRDEEEQFLIFLEWDVLRNAIAHYLGLENDSFDYDRCLISAIEYHQDGIEINEIILPPKELPPVMPCKLADTQ